MQAGIGDKEFLRSMIPHHSGAILMCEQATLTDPEIKALCRGIVDGQRQEIAQMEAIRKHAARAALWLSISASSFSPLVVRQ